MPRKSAAKSNNIITKQKKLRILVASDVHGDARVMKKLAERAYKEKVDVVVICGDLTDFDTYSKGMIAPFLEKKKEVLFVVGNHDITAGDVFADKYKIKNLQFYPVKIKNVGFFGCGTASVGPNVLSEEEIAYYINKGFEKVKDAEKKVLVTHMRPAGSVIEKMIPRLRYSGSEAIREAVKKFKPDVNVCGHIHEAEDLVEKMGNTLVIGAGPEGKIIEV
ncbi:MAG: metallophosphoesterase [Candidatus Aenigmarchaeota archaeon]|nr:metallophosphoesterase [Candidatus Aenigmarchaeota archaeon]